MPSLLRPSSLALLAALVAFPACDAAKNADGDGGEELREGSFSAEVTGALDLSFSGDFASLLYDEGFDGINISLRQRDSAVGEYSGAMIDIAGPLSSALSVGSYGIAGSLAGDSLTAVLFFFEGSNGLIAERFFSEEGVVNVDEVGDGRIAGTLRFSGESDRVGVVEVQAAFEAVDLRRRTAALALP